MAVNYEDGSDGLPEPFSERSDSLGVDSPSDCSVPSTDPECIGVRTSEILFAY